VVRDRDVLQDLSRRAGCRVYLSVPTVDDDAWRRLEPGTAHPLQRLRAVRELVDAGIDAGVLMAPIVPGLTSQPSKLERTVQAIAASGARSVGAMVMHLEAGTRDHFMRFLAREYPELVDRYGHLYAGKYAPKAYVQRVQEVVGMLKARYGLPTRRRASGGTTGPR
jgi:DNA repair photolyase